MIPDHLRIQPGKQALTPAQEAEAQRFAQERIAPSCPPSRWMSRRPKPSCTKPIRWPGWSHPSRSSG